MSEQPSADSPSYSSSLGISLTATSPSIYTQASTPTPTPWPPSMSYITAAELDRVLERAKDKDPLGRKIAEAMELIEGVLDDYG